MTTDLDKIVVLRGAINKAVRSKAFRCAVESLAAASAGTATEARISFRSDTGGVQVSVTENDREVYGWQA